MKDKYITFKRADFGRILAHQDPRDLSDVELKDAVVIRRQDIFAAPALSEYAGQIVTGMELAEQMGVPRDMLKGLQRIADYFYEQAELARQSPVRKVPD